ncbi:MAG: NADH-quinone oxidoreductase subunit A [Elusimicrobia bacterium]|nr:NADH-quinone oxidoreductase subunit A [Candidatus Liberimonas magnetica]
MIDKLLFIPPLAFILILTVSFILSAISSKLAFKTKDQSDEKKSCYACGEDIPKHRMQPEYTQFFHFAFFFTVMHVFVLIIACVPKLSIGFGNIALFFLVALSGLLILFRD